MYCLMINRYAWKNTYPKSKPKSIMIRDQMNATVMVEYCQIKY